MLLVTLQLHNSTFCEHLQQYFDTATRKKSACGRFTDRLFTDLLPERTCTPGGNANLRVCTSFAGMYAAKVTPGLQKRLTVLSVRRSL